MANDFLPLQGMNDISFPEVAVWQQLEAVARRVLADYNFTEIRTPILERTEVFTGSLGEATDIVSKEMYRFEDRGGRDVCLRPEGTASAMRFLAGQGLDAVNARVYYMGPMFRCERHQRGRYRQFHQIGVEALGEPSALRDAEMIELQCALFNAFGIRDISVQVNSLGRPQEREELAERLRARLRPHADLLGEDFRRQLAGNVFRILDSKDPAVQGVLETLPDMLEWYDDETRAHFDRVCSELDQSGIPYEVNPRLVRGLDYYGHTVWEITSNSEQLGSQNALAGGGRYRFDKGGKQPLEGVGFGIGVERAILALDPDYEALQTARRSGAWLVGLGDEAHDANYTLLRELRTAGVACGMMMEAKGMKPQMKQANKSRFKFAVIRGESELAEGTVQLKNLEEGSQEVVPVGELAGTLAKV